MSVQIEREDSPSLAEYATIPAAFQVRDAIALPLRDRARRPLPRRSIPAPYWKDYDAIPGNHPRDWAKRFATSRAVFLVARSAARRIGGAVVVIKPADAVRLGGRAGFALLWDLRVAPEFRGRGVGRALVAAAESIARDHRLRGVVAETQDVNIAACELYAGAGYVITNYDPEGYPTMPGEALILWIESFKDRCAYARHPMTPPR